MSSDFERLIGAMRKRMVNCVWRIVRDPVDINDVLQDSLAQAWEQFDEISRHPRPDALILRICACRALDHLRRQNAHRATIERSQMGTLPDVEPPNPAEHMQQREFLEGIRSFLCRLSPREAEAITLLALEEMEISEIASAMGCAPSTVRVLLARARARFRNEFRNAEGTDLTSLPRGGNPVERP